VIVGFLLAGWNNWWLMAVWLAVLFGLIGGSVPGQREHRQRLASILSAIYLLSILLMWIVPHLFTGLVLDDALVLFVRYGLPVLPFAIVLIRVTPTRTQAPVAVDLFYSVLLVLLVAALVLGSFVVKETSHGNYPIALAQTLFVIALVLVVISWLWNPHGGFSGIGHLLSRYLMSLGLPFERWMQQLAELAERETQPLRFLALALEHMQELPWVTGVEWEAKLGEGRSGTPSAHAAEVTFHDVRLKIYTSWELSPAVRLHLNLLTQLVGHFYEAKRREQAERQHAYTQAIYETGARLTHDVKNLLQSLRALCAAAESSTPDHAADLRALIQRQLPQITKRLNTTLDKLQKPQEADTSNVDSAIWWKGITQRYAGRNVQFTVDGPAEPTNLPGELFDSVADNLIENALAKRVPDGELEVRVTFSPARGGTLIVCDSGDAIEKPIASQLFDAPINSEGGLGVGLYHAAKQAAQLNYRLALGTNDPGRVCFVLTRAGDGSQKSGDRKIGKS
jgi:signal transduction histidine kinase